MAVTETPTTPYHEALPTPSLLMILEATGKMVKTPRDKQNKAIPKSALSMSNFSFTVGIYIAQVPNQILILVNTHAAPKYLGLDKISHRDFIYLKGLVGSFSAL